MKQEEFFSLIKTLAVFVGLAAGLLTLGNYVDDRWFDNRYLTAGLFQFLAVYPIGGDAGPLPFGSTVVVELEPGNTLLKDCSVSGTLSYKKEKYNCYPVSAIYVWPSWQCPRCPDGSRDGEPGDGCRDCCSIRFIKPGAVSLKVDGVFAGSDTGSGARGFSISGFSGVANQVLGLPMSWASMSQEKHTQRKFSIVLEGAGNVKDFNVGCGEDTCASKWECGVWSGCDGIKRTRICKDLRCSQPNKIEEEACSFECTADSGCVDVCFGKCINHECVYPDSPREYKTLDHDFFQECAKWKKTPVCEWDYSDCSCELYCKSTGTVPECAGSWDISGSHPECVCNYVCEKPGDIVGWIKYLWQWLFS